MVMITRNRRNRRPLDDIAADIHKLQRSNVFEIGDLLLEAKEQLDHGEFLPWLREEFPDWSEDSAQRAMNVARLGNKYRSLRNLKLPRTTLYDLVDLDADEDDDTPDELIQATITALAEQATDSQLKAAAAARIIELTRLRQQFGDYPEATLFALDDVTTKPPKPWRDKVIEALKAKSPTTEEAAKTIILKVMREHVAGLYEDTLPEFEPDPDIFDYLAKVRERDRAAVLQELLAAEPPVTVDNVRAACWPITPRASASYQDQVEEDGEADAEEADADEQQSDPAPAATLDPRLLEALKVVLEFARRPTPESVAGITAGELETIISYVQQLQAEMREDNRVQSVADRAAARSRLHAASIEQEHAHAPELRVAGPQGEAAPHDLDIPPSLRRT
jgi:hypothetical protein